MERPERTKPTDGHLGLRRRVGISGVAVPVEVLDAMPAMQEEQPLPGTADEGGHWVDVDVDALSYSEYLKFANDTYADCSD